MKFRIAAFAIIATACALVLWPPRAARHDLRITFIDVGQGDAILVQTPRGHALMIDTGGKLERGKSEDGSSVAEAVGERVVVPFLIRQGIHHVDVILLTHPHGDHQDFRRHYFEKNLSQPHFHTDLAAYEHVPHALRAR